MDPPHEEKPVTFSDVKIEAEKAKEIIDDLKRVTEDERQRIDRAYKERQKKLNDLVEKQK